MKLLFKSFATRLSVYTISFTIIVFTTTMILFYTYSQEKITEHAIQNTHGLLTNMATEIGGLLSSVETTVRQSTWVIEENLDKPDSLYKIIGSVAENNDLILSSGIAFEPNYYKDKGEYFMLYASLQDGKTVYQRLGGKDYDYPCMDWYLIPKMLKHPYWSEPYYDEGGGNFIMSTYSYPLYDKKGNLIAIFTANISLTQFTNMVDKLKPYESSYSFMLSRNGSYMTHNDRSKIMNETVFANAYENHIDEYEHIGKEMLAGNTGTVQFNMDGKSSYAFYTSIPNIGWSVCNISPANVILHELHSTSYKIIILSIIGILLLFLITYYIIVRTVRPLEEFSKTARTIATGHFDVKLPDIKSNDEMKDLHDSFEYMQRSLAEYVGELQITTASKERIESELNIAHEIQMGMIPKTFPPFAERNDVDLHATLKPAKEVGGDLYDFFIENEKLFFAIGDVSGKGVPASLFMAITRSLFHTLSTHSLSPKEIMIRLNNSISENNESNMFVTLIIGILDLPTGVLKLCNAGHNPPILIKPDGSAEYMKIRTNLFVGVLENHDYIEDEIVLEEGSKLFLYTDGVTEAENVQKELYSDELLLEKVIQNSSLEVKEIVETISDSVDNHVKEAKQSDDLTILVIHYKSKLNGYDKRN